MAPAPPRRLDPCPCGSGRRYKDCHGSLSPAAASPAPGFAEALALRREGRLAEALERLDRGLAEAPRSERLHNLRGLVHQDLMELGAARRDFEEAIAIAPAFPEAHVNLGLLLLLEGDHARGFGEFEWRTRVAGYADYAAYPFGMPRWKGDSLAGKRLLVHAEQGQGDTIQFARFIAPLARSGATIDLFCQPPLLSLMGRIEGVRHATSELVERPTHDFHAPIFDVGAFQLREPGAARWFGPYIAPLAERLAMFEDIDALPRPRIGIAWKGSALHANDSNRSMPREIAARLVTVGATFLNMQPGEPPLDPRMVDLAPRLRDWDDTAAALARIDLLVSVDTAIAHLAGAMGKPVWMLLPFSPDWRWGVEVRDTPWYPGTRLLRQGRRGDWVGVVGETVASYPLPGAHDRGRSITSG